MSNADENAWFDFMARSLGGGPVRGKFVFPIVPPRPGVQTRDYGKVEIEATRGDLVEFWDWCGDVGRYRGEQIDKLTEERDALQSRLAIQDAAHARYRREAEYLVDALRRIVDRWQTGTQVEGDYVRANGEVVRDGQRVQSAQRAAECERLKQERDAAIRSLEATRERAKKQEQVLAVIRAALGGWRQAPAQSYEVRALTPEDLADDGDLVGK